MEKPSPTTLWLVAGVGLLLLIVLYFASTRSENEDRLGDAATIDVPQSEAGAKGCTGGGIAAGLKHALFVRAQEFRGGDADAYREIEAQAVVRMENEALEEELGDGLACTASVAIDLPPGIAAAGGQRNVMGDVDYLVSASGSGVALRNTSSLITALASLSRSNNAMTSPLDSAGSDDSLTENDVDNETDLASPEPGPSPRPVPPPRSAQPSFDCSNAGNETERAICTNPSLAELDRQMAAAYNRAMAGATPGRQAILRQTRDRFLVYRDNCPSDRCVANTYNGRLQEIADIVAGRWQPPR
jgi:hypothetical protein